MEKKIKETKNIDPEFFGKYFWFIIHLVNILTHNDKTLINDFKIFIKTLACLIPCCKCRNHFKQNLKKITLKKYIKSGNILKWSFDMHNLVNKQLNKKKYNYKNYIKKFNAVIEKKEATSLYFWHVIHLICFSVPKNLSHVKKNIIKKFINSICNILHGFKYIELFKKHNKGICKYKQRDELINWSYKLHNKLNLLTMKKKYNFNKYVSRYEDNRLIKTLE